MGQYQPTAQDFKHMQWCINNEIKISPMAFSTYEWYIDIEIKQRPARGTGWVDYWNEESF